jgi:hypothetical protein
VRWLNSRAADLGNCNGSDYTVCDRCTLRHTALLANASRSLAPRTAGAAAAATVSAACLALVQLCVISRCSLAPSTAGIRYTVTVTVYITDANAALLAGRLSPPPPPPPLLLLCLLLQFIVDHRCAPTASAAFDDCLSR